MRIGSSLVIGEAANLEIKIQLPEAIDETLRRNANESQILLKMHLPDS